MKRSLRLSVLALCLLGIAQPCPYFLANTLQGGPCAKMTGQTSCGKDVKQCAKQSRDQRLPGHPGTRHLLLLHCVPEDYCSKAPQPMIPVCLADVVLTQPLVAAAVGWQDAAFPIPIGREILNLNLRI